MRALGMSFNENGEQVQIYDTITASQIEDGDQILFNDDPIEVTSVIDDGTFLIKGYSHLSGDSVIITLTADTEVMLWSV